MNNFKSPGSFSKQEAEAAPEKKKPNIYLCLSIVLLVVVSNYISHWRVKGLATDDLQCPKDKITVVSASNNTEATSMIWDWVDAQGCGKKRRYNVLLNGWIVIREK